MSRYVMALDQGTTSSRTILFDHSGRIVSMSQQEFPQLFPGPGHVEHDPEAIWSSQIRTARDAMVRVHATPADIAAIGVTNQRETTVLWEKATGRPVANAIVWQSRVTAPICERLKAAGHEPMVRQKTGLVLDAYFSGTKIKHLLDAHDGLRARAARGEILFGTIDTFLVWRLTGGAVHVTDVSNASRTLLFNIHTHQWDDELLAAARCAPGDAARGPFLQWRFWNVCTRVAGGGDSAAGRGGRSAGGDVRTGLFHARVGEEHLWHRMFPADEHRPDSGHIDQWPPDHGGLDNRRTDHLLPRGGGVRRGGGGAVAEGRIAGDRVGGGDK